MCLTLWTQLCVYDISYYDINYLTLYTWLRKINDDKILVFDKDIIVGPLLIPSLIDHVGLKANVVVHGRNYVEIVIYDRHDSH